LCGVAGRGQLWSVAFHTSMDVAFHTLMDAVALCLQVRAVVC
jgi:hypothetical protein